jgi:hypothetical protein
MKNLSLIILLFLIASCGKVLKTHVKGKVLNPVTGQGIENVRVILQKSGSGIPSGLKTVEAVYTDAGGNFDISARTLKGLTASVVLDGNEYYSIGWKKDGEVYSILSPKKGNVTNADFHAVPFGELILSINNINCQGITDSMQFNSIYQYGTDDGYSTWRTGCYNYTSQPFKLPVGYHYYKTKVIRSGITTYLYDTVFVSEIGVPTIHIEY